MELSEFPAKFAALIERVNNIEATMAKKEYVDTYMVKKETFDTRISELKESISSVRSSCTK